MGAVDFNEIGSSVIILPGAQSIGSPLVAHVDIRLSSPSENAYIVISIWKPSVQKKNSSLTIRNSTNMALHIRQASVEYSKGITAEDCTLIIPPFSTMPFGWTLIREDNRLQVGVVFGDEVHADTTVSNTSDIVFLSSLIDMDQLTDDSDLGLGFQYSLDIWGGSGKVLAISTATVAAPATVSPQILNNGCNLSLIVDLWAISLSIVAGNEYYTKFHFNCVYNFIGNQRLPIGESWQC